ncbi:MAG: M48 family metalloprotease [Candidatus Heimdallarchaeota archaeon]|nr:M48 family metalloprotease [Candidatus Heimdallarchaeota archaeon]MDH5645104.1 M48 family metalloprotease [Candidatus Heimdallarchaeota archaeon]
MANKYHALSIKIWIAYILFIISTIIQLLIAIIVDVQPSDTTFFRYSIKFNFQPDLPWFTLTGLFLFPFVSSYLSSVSYIKDNPSIVEVYGRKSLLHRIKLEFHLGNPEKLDLSKENITAFLSDLAQGEPIGTYENLEMLLAVGIKTDQLIHKTKSKSVKRVFISDSLVPNAYTLRFIPIPILGQDWIILNRNVVEILNQEEIQAVIAHEIGHTKKYDSWINSILFAPRLILSFVWIFLLLKVGIIIFQDPFSVNSFIRLAFLLSIIASFKIVVKSNMKLIEYAHRNSELIADNYAAKIIDPNILMNALIKIGLRGDIINSIEYELKKYEKIIPEIDFEPIITNLLFLIESSELSREKTIGVIQATFNEQVKHYLFNKYKDRMKQDEITELYNKLISKIKESQIELEESLSNKIILLEPILKHANGLLNNDQIYELIKTINESDSYLFWSEFLEIKNKIPKSNLHPSLSSRIQIIYKNYIL